MNSKRIVSLFLVLCFVFSLISCGADVSLNETAENRTDASSENKTGVSEENEALPSAEASDHTIEVVGAHETLAAIPTARIGMSVDELREICTDFMRLQTSVPWIPAETYHYVIDEKHEEQIFKRNTVYGGLPYTHNSSSLYTFLEFYDDETGVLTLPNQSYFELILGNNCADAVFWAWARFSSSIRFSGTYHMLEKNGVLRVGSYTYSDSIDDFAKYTTRRICDENGEQTMYESYALVKKGDGFVMYTTAGHAFMASCDAIVVRKADGTIDPDESGVYIMEQHSNQTIRPLSLTESQHQAILSGASVTPQSSPGGGSGDDPTVYNIGGVDNFFSFRSLFQKSYLPVTCAELRGKTIEEAHAAIENLPADASSAAELRVCAISSNYRISKVHYAFTDAEGKIVYETDEYVAEKNMYSHPVSLSQPVLQRTLARGQTYTLTISALVGTGETLPVGSCSFTV